MEHKMEQIRNKDNMNGEQSMIKKRKYRKREKQNYMGNQKSKRETVECDQEQIQSVIEQVENVESVVDSCNQSQQLPMQDNQIIHNIDTNQSIDIHLVNYIHKLEMIIIKTRDKLKRERKHFCNFISSLSNYMDHQSFGVDSIEQYLETQNSIRNIDQPIELKVEISEKTQIKPIQKTINQVQQNSSVGKTKNVIKIVIDQKDKKRKYNRKEEKKEESIKKRVKQQLNQDQSELNQFEIQNGLNEQQNNLKIDNQMVNQQLQMNQFGQQFMTNINDIPNDTLINYYKQLQEQTQQMIMNQQNQPFNLMNMQYLNQFNNKTI